jgi:hypothetical protein
MRAAYIAWLLAVQADNVDDTTLEPPLPPGFLDLSAPLKALVEFLRIDADLLAAAAERSGSEVEDTGALHAWVAALSPLAKDQWLNRAVNEPDLALGAELRRTFRAGGTKVTAAPRTVAELRAAADELRAERERVEARRAERARKTADAARKKKLDALAARLDAAWTELEELIAKSAYREALELTIDLRDLAVREGTAATFAERFAAMRKRQARRRGFFDRWRQEMK